MEGDWQYFTKLPDCMDLVDGKSEMKIKVIISQETSYVMKKAWAVDKCDGWGQPPNESFGPLVSWHDEERKRSRSILVSHDENLYLH